MHLDPIILQTIIIGGISLICGAILAAAAHFLVVREDPRVTAVAALLPGINCGGCGLAGCAAYAEGIVKQGLPVDLCRPGGAKTAQAIGAVMGAGVQAKERCVALVRCQGNNTVARSTAIYNGVADCTAMEQVGGSKACRFGCLGLGSCAHACPAGAIEITDGLALVHPELCIGCSACVNTCPRKLIVMAPESSFIHVLCRSQDRGPAVKKICSVGCIACTLCVKTCGGQGIRMEGNLAVVDYATPPTNEEVIAKCPQHSIVKRSGLRKEPA